MPNFAVIENDEIVNVIVAENQALAEQVTETECLEIENEPGSPGIGWKRVKNKWINPNISIEVPPKPDTK